MTDNPASDPTSEAAKSSEAAKAPAKSARNWTARISLMIAVVALVAAGYLGYQLIYLQPFVSQSAQTQAALFDLEQQMRLSLIHI